MYSRGTLPPTTSLTNSSPSAPESSAGSNFNQTWPYWPRPPDCRTNFPSISQLLRIVSRYATWGLPIFASTVNSRRIRSTRISRCSSPIPEIIVWPLSSSVLTLNEGSSWASLPKATPIFSWSALVLGSTATEITGSGNSMRSRIILSLSAQSVSPVVVSLRPIAAAISPARTSLISSLLLACICTIRPTRSRFILTELNTAVPLSRVPE